MATSFRESMPDASWRSPIPREWLGWALCYLGLPVNDVTPDVLQRVREVWEKWMPQVAVFDSDTAVKVMLSGTVDIAITWSGDAGDLLADVSRLTSSFFRRREPTATSTAWRFPRARPTGTRPRTLSTSSCVPKSA